MTTGRPSEGPSPAPRPRTLAEMRGEMTRGGPTASEVGADRMPAEHREGVDRALEAVDKVMKGMGDLGKNLSKYFGSEDLKNLCDLMKKFGMSEGFISMLRGAEKSGAVVVRGIEKKLIGKTDKKIVRDPDPAKDTPHFTAIQNEITRANQVCTAAPITGSMMVDSIVSRLPVGDTKVEALVPLAKASADALIAEYRRTHPAPAPAAAPGTTPPTAPPPGTAPTPAPGGGRS